MAIYLGETKLNQYLGDQKVLLPGPLDGIGDPNRIMFTYQNTRHGNVIAINKHGMSFHSDLSGSKYLIFDSNGEIIGTHFISEFPNPSWSNDTGCLISYIKHSRSWVGHGIVTIKFIDGPSMTHIGDYIDHGGNAYDLWYRPGERRAFNGHSNVQNTPYGKNLWFLTHTVNDVNGSYYYNTTDGSDIFVEVYSGNIKINEFYHRFHGKEYYRAPFHREGLQYYLHESGFGAIIGGGTNADADADWMIWTKDGIHFNYIDYSLYGIKNMSIYYLYDWGIVTAINNNNGNILIITKDNVYSPYDTGISIKNGDLAYLWGIIKFNRTPAIFRCIGSRLINLATGKYAYTIEVYTMPCGNNEQSMIIYSFEFIISTIDFFRIIEIQTSDDGQKAMVVYYYQSYSSRYFYTHTSDRFETQFNPSGSLIMRMDEGKEIYVQRAAGVDHIAVAFDYGNYITLYGEPTQYISSLDLKLIFEGKIPDDYTSGRNISPEWAHFGNDFYKYRFYRIDE